MDTTDLVPAELRAQWVAEGHYPGDDLIALFAQQVERHPDRVAVIDDGGSVTYAELATEARKIGAYLQGRGIRPGDVVALQFSNKHEICAADLAVVSVGAISLAYPGPYRHSEVRTLLTRSGAVMSLFDRSVGEFDVAGMMAEFVNELPTLRHLAVLGEPAPGCDSLDDVLSGSDPCGWTPVPLEPSDPARILVTSGTGGDPKMVLYSHHGVGGGIGNLVAAVQPGDDARILLQPPLCSGFGAIGTYATIARSGLTLVVTPEFDPVKIFKLVERERVTHVFGVPTMLAMMLETKPDGVDLSSVRAVGAFGAPMSEERIRRILDMFENARFINGWGCADGAICVTDRDDPLEKSATTVGRPSPSLSDIRILGDDGAEVPSGREGEVCARGPCSPLRYLNSPDLDERYRFDGGWVRTGDLGAIDDDGYLRIAGRKTDIINRGGFKIGPAETEAALLTHPAIAEAACVGMADERLGERMCAFVVLREGHDLPTVDDIGLHLTREGVARVKHPDRLETIDAMPLSPAGKILKRVLRERIVGTGPTPTHEQYAGTRPPDP